MNNYDAWKLQESPDSVDLECCDHSRDRRYAGRLTCGCVFCNECDVASTRLCRGCARLEAFEL